MEDTIVPPGDGYENPAWFDPIDVSLGPVQNGSICYPAWTVHLVLPDERLAWWLYLRILSRFTTVDHPASTWTARFYPAELADPGKVSVKRVERTVATLVDAGVLIKLDTAVGARLAYRIVDEEPA
jgi:hypothetical protein